MTLNVCLIGAGRIGKIHADNLARHSGVTLSHVVDPYQPAADELAARYGAATVSLDAALAEENVQGVIIASATNTHAEFIEKSARAGKAIFCEKPVDLSRDRARIAVAVAEEENCPLLLGFNRRYDPDFQALKQAVDSGRIGDVEMVHITSRDPSPPPLDYVKVSGGLFKDMMIHDFDVARWLLAEDIASVSATASCLVDPAIAEAGDVDSALVTLKTTSGKLCMISNSRRATYGYDQRIEVHGSSGRVSVDNVRDSRINVTDDKGDHSDLIQHFFLERYEAAYRAEVDHFVEVMLGKATPATTGEDGVAALILAEAAAESLASGKVVGL